MYVPICICTMSSTAKDTAIMDNNEDPPFLAWWKGFGTRLPGMSAAANLFMLFSKDRREALREEQPNVSFGEMGKLLGQEFRALSEEKRAGYQQQATENKRKHQQLVARYRQVESAGDAGDMDTLRNVVAARAHELSNNNKPEGVLELDELLSFGLGFGFYTRHLGKGYARYIISSLNDAIENGHSEACEFLWNQCAKEGRAIWEQGKDVLTEAEEDEEDDEEDGDDAGVALVQSTLKHPLVVAAKKNQSHIVQLFLASSNNNPLVQLFWEACDSSRWEEMLNCLPHLKSYHDPERCRIEVLNCALLLIQQHGAVPQDLTFSVLLLEASYLNPTPFWNELLVYWDNKHPSGRDATGNTLLHLVCKNSNTTPGLVQALMEHTPASVRALDVAQGLPPIYYACSHNLDLDVVFLLGLQNPEIFGRMGDILSPTTS